MSQQNSTQIKCTDCGKNANVPFKPTAGKPVYCRECLAKHRPKRTETRRGLKTGTQGQNFDKLAWSRRRGSWK